MKFIVGIIILMIFVGGPLFVQYTHCLPGSNGNGDWLGFWGSYLGVIPSVLVAYLVAKLQIDANSKDTMLHHTEQLYLNNLRKLHETLNNTLVITNKLDDIKKICKRSSKGDSLYEPHQIASALNDEFKKMIINSTLINIYIICLNLCLKILTMT